MVRPSSCFFSMSDTAFNSQKCEQRNRIAGGRLGINAFPLQFKPAGERREILASKTVGSLPDTPEASLRAINALLPEGAQKLGPEDVYIHHLEAANSNFIGDRFMFLHDSTLKNIAKGAKNGISFMNSHRTGGLSSPAEMPFGQTFAGLYEQGLDGKGNPVQRTTVGVWMLRGVEPNGSGGPSTDTLNRMLESGSLRDVSVGLRGGETICDVCGNDVNDYENCSHIPGTVRDMSADQIKSQKQRDPNNKTGVATYSLFNADFGEISAVYDGAVPGAGVQKVMNFARHADLQQGDVRAFLLDAMEQYGALLPFDLSEVVEIKPEPAPVANPNKMDNPNLLQQIATRLGIGSEEHAAIVPALPAQAATPDVFAPAPAGPSARELALEAQLTESHTQQAAQFAASVVSGLSVGADNRTALEAAVAKLQFNALQGTPSSPSDVKAAFSVLPSANVGATLAPDLLEGAQQAQEKAPVDPNAIDQNARKNALSSFPAGQNALAKGVVQIPAAS